MNLIKWFIAILVVFPWPAGAQSRSEMVFNVLGLHPHDESIQADPAEHLKCASTLLFQRKNDRTKSEPKHELFLSLLNSRPVLPYSRKSVQGNFRIHFDTAASSVNTPALLSPQGGRIPYSHQMYIDSVATIFEHVRSILIDGLGYDAPPADADPSGPEYDVYILNQGYYGLTNTENGTQLNAQDPIRYPSWIEIDNDFLGFPTSGLDGLRVTAAHEYHHAIQLGAYGVWFNRPNYDFFFNELTSTWMEDVVYDDINDYLYYLPSFFYRFRDFLGRTFEFTLYNTAVQGYERAVWAHYLERKYGSTLMRRIWEGSRTNHILRAMDDLFVLNGTSLREEFNQFSVWNYFTGERADSMRFYREGHLYPLYSLNGGFPYGQSVVFSSSAYSLSAQMLGVVDGTDTTVVILSNNEARQLQSLPAILSNYEFERGTKPGSNHILDIGNGRSLSFNSPVNGIWAVMLPKSGLFDDRQTAPAPSPWVWASHKELLIPVSTLGGTAVRIRLISSDLETVHDGYYSIEYRGSVNRNVVSVSQSELSDKVSTGIYFLQSESESKRNQWKIAIIR